MGERLTIGSILGRAGGYIAGDALPVLATVIILAGLGSAADVYQLNINFVFNFASVAIEYFLLRRLCEREGLVGDAGAGGFGGFFGLGILSGLGILLGCVLLVVPGLFLAARWSAADGLLIAEKRGVTDAMGESWRLTRGHTLAIMLAFLVTAVPAIVGMGVALAFGDAAGNATPVAALIMNVGLFVTLVSGWYAAIAVYALLADTAPQLGEVFA